MTGTMPTLEMAGVTCPPEPVLTGNTEPPTNPAPQGTGSSPVLYLSGTWSGSVPWGTTLYLSGSIETPSTWSAGRNLYITTSDSSTTMRVHFTDGSNPVKTPAYHGWTTDDHVWCGADDYRLDLKWVKSPYVTASKAGTDWCTVDGYTGYEMGWVGTAVNTARDGWVRACWHNGLQIVTPAERMKKKLKEVLKSRHAPAIITQTKPVGHTEDIREMRARDTLRRFIGQDKYRNFLRTGWVSVQARSGLVYQIFPGHGITSVFDRGRLVERLCVVLSGEFPPTDSLVIRYILILNNEQLFREKARYHDVEKLQTQRRQIITIEERPLVEIAREIRAVRAKVG